MLKEALRTAGRELLRAGHGGSEIDFMAKVAILRRCLIDELARRFGSDWGHSENDCLEQARQRDCPLFAPFQNETEEELEAVLRLGPVAGFGSLGELYQQLSDFELVATSSKTVRVVGSRSRRRKAGLFYTPSWMAGEMVRWLVEGLEGKQPPDVIDPACGSGRLLFEVALALADRWYESRAQGIRRLVGTRIFGIDIDPLSAALCRTRFWLEADPRQGPVEGLDGAVFVGDSIRGDLSDPDAGFDWNGVFGIPERKKGFGIVVTNPPFEVLTGYARRQGLADYARAIRSSGYGYCISGTLNTWKIFLERVIQLTAEGGRFAVVLPLSFTADRTAAPLRKLLLRNGWLRRLAFYPESSRAFRDALQGVIWIGGEKFDGRKSFALVEGDEEARRCSLEWIESLDGENLPIPAASASAVAMAVRMHRQSPSSFGRIAMGRVGEVDQTVFRKYMKSQAGGALLVRGQHLSPYVVNLSEEDTDRRWLDKEGFEKAKGNGAWKEHVRAARVVQTGIVNMEASRRLVAARVPAGVYLGNSVNYWIGRRELNWPEELLDGYLLGLLNSTPYEWRFRLTSSNNNINLYEISVLPLPILQDSYPAERIGAFLERSMNELEAGGTVLGAVRRITAGWDSPDRSDRAVAMLMGRVALEREKCRKKAMIAWLDGVLDHLVNWHLGMDEPDLERMYEDIPSRRPEVG